MHRIEVLRPGRTDTFDFWTNTDGSIYLCREQGSRLWQAIVDGDVVIDQMHALEPGFTHAVKALTAAAPSGLVPLLALQEDIHLLLEHEPLGTAPSVPA